MITASKSWIENSGTFKKGNAVFSSGPATLTPQSSNTLLLGVCKSIHDLPTSLNPPILVKRVQSLSYLTFSWILEPKLVKNFFLSLLLCIMVLRILPIISDLIGGVLKILGAQPVFLTISLLVTPYFPITSPGFCASIIASLVTSSNAIFVICASSGTISSIVLIVFSGSIKTLLSERITILLRKSLAKFLTKSPLSVIISGFLV